MSYNCDLEIPIRRVPSNKQRLELYDILLKFRPESIGLIDCDSMVIQFPSNFSDDPTGALADFMEKHKLTITVVFTDEDGEEEDLVYIDGVLQDDDE